MNKTRWLVVTGLTVVGVIAFLLFRPDTLFTEVRSDETLEEAFAPTTSTTTTIGDATTSTLVAPSTTLPDESTTTLANAGPIAVTMGQFRGIDHSAEGTATIYESDGQFVLRLEEDTRIQNGPDLYVWLIEGEDYEGGTPATFIDLGVLKGTVGGQNYDLPADFDPDVARTVLVWCLRFAVPFAAAPLT